MTAHARTERFGIIAIQNGVFQNLRLSVQKIGNGKLIVALLLTITEKL